jgi:hypothetical protein
MKKDRVWFIICGKRTVCYMIAWNSEMLGNNTAFGVVELFPLAIEKFR